MTLSPGTRLGPYDIVAAIGAGGMGEVFRARDTKLNRDVAIKVLPAEFASDRERVARFKREAQILASLNHPNIAAIYGLEEVGARHASPDAAGPASDDTGARREEPGPGMPGPYGSMVALVMELVLGEDLAARLKRGAIPVDEAIAIARQIAEALEEAHEHGIVHRDLKPANVKVTPDGKVKVLDFGLAKAMEGAGAASTSGASHELSHSPTLTHQGTQAGMIMGTAAYMSPEQARGKNVDKRADIWAFGVVLFEMLTGERLFAGETVSDVLAAVLTRDPDWKALPSRVPPSVRTLVERCLDRDPRKRLRDIGDARFAWESRADAAAAPSPVKTGSRRLPALAPWAIAAVALGALALRFGSSDSRPREVLHFEIAYPPNVEPIAELQGGFGLAPDGRTVVLIGVKEGVRALFVRPLDRSEARQIGDSSGANTVAFSPDGRSVVFVPGSTVVTRISLEDEQRTVVANGGDLSGDVLWTSSGDILFSRGGMLWAAPAAGGGTPRRIVAMDESRQEVIQTSALVPPGSKKVLFASQTAQGGQERIDAAPLDGSGVRTTVIENAGTPVWSPTGHLLFSRDGGVWAVPFDPVSTTVKGSAVQVIPAGVIGNVRSSSLGYQVASDGTLVFIPATLSNKRVVTVTRDGSEKALDLPRDSYSNPRISPDGRTLLIGIKAIAIELLDLQRGTRARIAAAASGTSFPAWTPDGRAVAFRRFNLPYWAATDGSGKAGPIPGGVINDYPSSPGPDPDSILGVRIDPRTSGDIYLMSLSGRFPPKALLSGPSYEGAPALSPDRRYLLYQSNESGRAEIYVRRYPALDRQWQVSEGGGVQTAWSRNGREIYYRNGHSMMAVAFDGRGDAPILGKPVALFNDEYDFGQGLTIPNYDMMDDGRFIMFRRDTNGGRLSAVLNWTEELKRIIAAGGAK